MMNFKKQKKVTFTTFFLTYKSESEFFFFSLIRNWFNWTLNFDIFNGLLKIKFIFNSLLFLDNCLGYILLFFLTVDCLELNLYANVQRLKFSYYLLRSLKNIEIFFLNPLFDLLVIIFNTLLTFVDVQMGYICDMVYVGYIKFYKFQNAIEDILIIVFYLYLNLFKSLEKYLYSPNSLIRIGSWILFIIFIDFWVNFYKTFKTNNNFRFWILCFGLNAIMFKILFYVPAWIHNPEALYACIPLWKLLFLPLISMGHLLLLPKNNFKLLKFYAINWSFIIFIYMIIICQYLNICSHMSFGQQTIYPMYTFFLFNKALILYGIDSISILFLLLTGCLFIFIFLSLWNLEILELKKFIIVLYVLYLFLIHIFTVQNLLFFFFFFESVVYPMFFLILLGGSRIQKIKAGYYFFFFTVLGSLFMFISINYLLIQFGSLNMITLVKRCTELSMWEQNLIWFSFMFSFGIKIPMVPFHTWLPEAHVEAPTAGSVLLAGVLLKLGSYGIIRICFFLFPKANVYFSSYIYVICLVSIIYACLIAIRQSDIKRIIAYASVAHMNLIVLGLYSFTSVGIYGAIFQSISHGLVSGALFLLVGVLYTRYKSRLVVYYSGLTQVMPIFSTFYLLFTLANISFPLTSNFMGELLLFAGISKLYFGLLVLSLFSIILNTIYSLWLCNRILFGNVKSHLLIKFKDLSILEIFIFTVLFILVLLLGIFPNIVSSIPVHFICSLLYEIKTLSLIHSLYL